jgi:hypothetical protein
MMHSHMNVKHLAHIHTFYCICTSAINFLHICYGSVLCTVMSLWLDGKTFPQQTIRLCIIHRPFYVLLIIYAGKKHKTWNYGLLWCDDVWYGTYIRSATNDIMPSISGYSHRTTQCYIQEELCTSHCTKLTNITSWKKLQHMLCSAVNTLYLERTINE